jgi:hypothetical protein
MAEKGITAEELLKAAEAGRLRVPVEVGAFIVLQCVEQLASEPRSFSPENVRFRENGAVAIDAVGAASEHDAALAATHLLKRMLLAGAGASPSSLLSWLERSQGASALRLEAMRDEVEAALVPLNREAATRLLARFIRSSASAEGSSPGTFDDGALDAELDRFLRGEPTTTSATSRGASDLSAAKLVEKKRSRGPSVPMTLLVIALAALLGLVLSHPDLIPLID